MSTLDPPVQDAALSVGIAQGLDTSLLTPKKDMPRIASPEVSRSPVHAGGHGDRNAGSQADVYEPPSSSTKER